jgi:hypothetical protein
MEGSSVMQAESLEDGVSRPEEVGFVLHPLGKESDQREALRLSEVEEKQESGRLEASRRAEDARRLEVRAEARETQMLELLKGQEERMARMEQAVFSARGVPLPPVQTGFNWYHTPRVLNGLYAAQLALTGVRWYLML